MKADARRPVRIVSVFPGFGVGGAQVRFAQLANRFGGNAQHMIVSLNGDVACREKLDPSLDVQFPQAGHRRGRILRGIAHARHFLRAQAPDLVLTSNWGAIEWAIGARLAGLRHVHSEDGFGPEERSAQIPRRVLTRRLALRGSAVVLPSRSLVRIATEVWRLPPTHLHYIPNGIDISRFAHSSPMFVAGTGPVIGTLAALRPEKNISRLLRAFATLRASRPARLVVVGDGPERPALEQLAASLGIAGDTLFAGHSTHAERWLASFHVFALSSDTEQMPISLLEAMAAGVPAVCTDVGDVRVMLAAENLPFVTAVDDAAFAAGLASLLDASRDPVGAANRARAKAEFDEARMFAAWGKVLGVSLH
jgi:glycosyltransferase involved in cell wall biosynthesis